MKRLDQGYNDRLDESLGERHRGKHSQSMMDRRHESEGMEKKHKFAGDESMDSAYHHHMAHAHHKYMASHHKKKAHKK